MLRKLFFLSIQFLLANQIFSQEFIKHHSDLVGIVDQSRNTFEFVFGEYLKVVYSDTRKARLLIEKALKIAVDNQNVSQLAQAYYAYGDLEKYLGNTSHAQQWFIKCLELSRQNHLFQKVVKCYNNLGIIKKIEGNYKQAYNYYLKGLQIAEEKDVDKVEVANLLNNIANILSLQGYYKEAIKYLRKSTLISDDDRKNTAVYINLGQNYIELFKMDSASHYLTKALTLTKKYNNKIYEAAALTGMANIHEYYGNYPDALNMHFKAIKIEEDLGLKNEVLSSYAAVSNVYLILNKPDSAFYYLKQQRELTGDISKRVLADLKLAQANLYAEKGDYKSAFKVINEYILLKDSLFNEESRKQINEMKAKYETERKEREISFLRSEQLQKQLEVEKKENEILSLKNRNELQNIQLIKNKLIAENREKEIRLLNKEKELKDISLQAQENLIERQKTIRNIIILGAILVIIPTIILLLLYRQKLKTQKLIALQKRKINRQRDVEIKKNREIIAMRSNLAGQEVERKRIAKELHDGLGGNLAGIKVRMLKVMQHIPKSNWKDVAEVIDSIDATCEEVRTISHDLAPPIMEAEDFIGMLTNYIETIAHNQFWDLELDCYPKEELNMISPKIKIEIYRIIQELLNNVRKHAGTKRVDIQLIKHNDYVNILLEDHGKGFDINQIRDGIGLQNIKDRVNILNGAITFDSKIGRGTIVNIKIPC